VFQRRLPLLTVTQPLPAGLPHVGHATFSIISLSV
jgi:hypothetical protein